jgi:phytoene dehydrogenase-like protein
MHSSLLVKYFKNYGMYLAYSIDDRMENMMDKVRNQLLTLLDMCAFAYSQDPGKKARKDLEEACRLAERHALPEAELYRHIMRRLEQEFADAEAEALEAAPRRVQDSVSP